MRELATHIQILNQKNASYVLVTLVDVIGSAPQILGAKMLVTERGLEWGTVGGGKIEAHAILTAKNLLIEKKSSQVFTWNLQSDIGMSCGGKVSLFFDVEISNQWTIAIFGAGHIAQELTRVLSTWSARVFVFDTRQEWISRLPRAENTTTKLSDDLPSEIDQLPLGSSILCMTQGHATDLPILKKAFREFENFKMIGVIGSDVKARKIKQELIDCGISLKFVEKLRSPLGIDIGNNTPPEIAASICAEILAVRDEKVISVAETRALEIKLEKSNFSPSASLLTN